MTRLYKEKTEIPKVDMGRESTIPLLFEVNDKEEMMPSCLPETDGLYLRYDFIKTAFPYMAQDNYTRDFIDTLETVVLENEYLKASFAPSMGGKLWSLYDKVGKKELLFSNPVARPSYLATRNAWCSGGIEWNCGIFGHTPFTCSNLFAGALKMPDGTPVLRMYEFERVRGVVYQMDFFLPEGSKILFNRTRIVNPSYKATAMYWWSNIAVPHVEGARVIVPADSAYTPIDEAMHRVKIPEYKGIDVSYPDNNPVSVDYFFKTDDNRRRYHSQIGPDGKGFFECSTKMLKGRKIFVWGQGPGGKKWQEYLSGNGSDGKYCEIQCGLAYTQSECVPMPPMTAWEWLEGFGAIDTDPKKTHGTWDEARKEIENRLDDIITADALEKMLIDTRETALTPADELINMGEGWGALENIRREKAGLTKMCPHLDFGSTDPKQQPWLDLLLTGSLKVTDVTEPPVSYMRQKEWVKALEAAIKDKDKDNPYAYLMLGCSYLAEPDLLRARIYITKALELKKSAYCLYALSELERVEGDTDKSVDTLLESAYMALDDEDIAKIASKHLYEAGKYVELEKFTRECPEHVKALPRTKLYRACALAHLGRLDEAETILEDGGKWLQIPDIREGELTLSDLWYYIQDCKAGAPVDRSKVSPPYELDFRMFAV